jgi:hypothetical protein
MKKYTVYLCRGGDVFVRQNATGHLSGPYSGLRDINQLRVQSKILTLEFDHAIELCNSFLVLRIQGRGNYGGFLKQLHQHTTRFEQGWVPPPIDPKDPNGIYQYSTDEGYVDFDGNLHPFDNMVQ